MEKTLVILKPCTLQRGLVGEITRRFERKGLRLAGMKMVQLTDEVLSEHYSHLSSKPFFQRVKDSMMTAPVSFVVLKVWMLFKPFVHWRDQPTDVWQHRGPFAEITV